MKKIIYSTFKDLPLSLSFYESNLANSNKPAIIYFHGGGLIFGHRDDLPESYIHSFTQSGYPFISIDYVLAPEAKLDQIFLSISHFFQWFEENHMHILHLQSNEKILFGRSSGAYLALQWAKRIKVNAVIAFYGYHSLFHNEFLLPSHNFQKYPSLSETLVSKSIQKKPMVKTDLQRYLLYVFFRQSGTWIKNLTDVPKQLDTYSLTAHDLKNLPPTFLAASRSDEDVPYSFSQLMSRIIPKSNLLTFDNLPHDFDREVKGEASQESYRKLLLWLDNL